MSSLLKLRDYQQEAVDAVGNEWANGTRRTSLVMATGTGKTATAAHVIARFDAPSLFLVHRDELATQAEEAFRRVGLNVGVIKAGRDEVDAEVVVGSVQTLANPARLARYLSASSTYRRLVVVDEAHHAAAASYRKILTGLGAFDDRGSTAALGLSATLYRADTQGLGAVWESVAYRYDILDGIDDGWLCDVVGQRVTVDGLSLIDAKISGGDFTASSLSELLSSDDAISATVAAYLEHAADKPGIVFTPDVHSAKLYANGFKAAGITAEAVWGEMPVEDRRLILKRYQLGEIQILANCMIFTEGTDLPRATVAVIARPTMNPALYIQMVGRVLRIFPGKDKALVLDVAGVSADHQLATLADLSSKRINEVEPGESLREAAAREARARNPKLAGYVIKTEEVNLFGRSRSAWLQTHGGIWFIPAGDKVVFLWPSKMPGLYSVGIRPLGQSGGGFLITDVDLDTGMTWGEQSAETYVERWQDRRGTSTVRPDRKSGRKSGPPSSGTIALARSLGIEVTSGTTGRELSGIIDVERASRALDRNGRK